MIAADTTSEGARGMSSRSAPLLVAIVGDSASGKTTFARGLEGRLGRTRVTRVRGDDYQRYDRRTRGALGLTPLHADANDLDRLEEDLDRLSRGARFDRPCTTMRPGGSELRGRWLGRPQREVADIVITLRRGPSDAPLGARATAGGPGGAEEACPLLALP